MSFGTISVLGLLLAVGALTAVILLRSWREERAALARAGRRTLPPRPAAVPAAAPAPEPAQWPAPESIQVAEPLLDAGEGAAGFYTEVAGLLSAELEANPARLDLRRKLLEVYSGAGLHEEFVQCAQAYLESTGGMPDEHWPEITRLGHALVPEHALFVDAPGGTGVRKFQRFHESVNQLKLHAMLREVAAGYEAAQRDPEFGRDLFRALGDGVRRPTPLSALPLADAAPIFAKREDVRAPDDDERINALGQCLLAQRLGRRGIVTASHDGVHGVAVATIASRLGLSCAIWMEESKLRHHYARVLQMRRLGAEVRVVPGQPQRDAASRAALQQALGDAATLHWVTDLTGGPHPYPMIVRDLQAVVGQEAAAQLRAATGATPGAVAAGVDDGYVGLGFLNAFLADASVPLYCVESPAEGAVRALREHGWLRSSGRVRFVSATDEQAMDALEAVFEATGLGVSLEAARTIAVARNLATPHSGPVLTLLSRPAEASVVER